MYSASPWKKGPIVADMAIWSYCWGPNPEIKKNSTFQILICQDLRFFFIFFFLLPVGTHFLFLCLSSYCLLLTSPFFLSWSYHFLPLSLLLFLNPMHTLVFFYFFCMLLLYLSSCKPLLWWFVSLCRCFWLPFTEVCAFLLSSSSSSSLACAMSVWCSGHFLLLVWTF